MADHRGIKTSIKRYLIFQYHNTDILCESYTVKKNDFLYKIFRNKGGISQRNFSEFIHIFKKFNTSIADINLIRPGQLIFIPLKKAGNDEFVYTTDGVIEVPVIEQADIPETEQKTRTTTIELTQHQKNQLNKYAVFLNGELKNKGKFYFPRQNESPYVLDLESIPLIKTKIGKRILIARNEQQESIKISLLKSYWDDLCIQDMSEVMKNEYCFSQKAGGLPYTYLNPDPVINPHDLLERIMSYTPYRYESESRLTLSLDGIMLQADFARIFREPGQKDVLINFANMYGYGLEKIKKRGFDIIFIPPGESNTEILKKIFSHLGFSIWDNPGFKSENGIKKLPGIYFDKNETRLFWGTRDLDQAEAGCLEKEGIRIVNI